MALETVKFFPIMVPDLAPIAQEVMEHYRRQEYEVSGGPSGPGKWHLSIRKGDTFKAIIGMKTALNIDLESTSSGTMVKAGIGVFGVDTVPQLLVAYVFWPILLAQIWGVVQQTRFDDEVIARIESTLVAHHRRRVSPSGSSANPPYGSSTPGGSAPGNSVPGSGTASGFCPKCNARLQLPARFCSSCGAKLTA